MKGRGSDRAVTATATERRTSVLAITLLLSIAAAVAGVGAGIGTGVASAQEAGGNGPTPVDSCTTISESGTYVLTTNVTNRTANPCISITANNVVFDGGGHTLAGDKPNYGIRVDNGAADQSNVTVRNVRAEGWVRAISVINASDSVVERTITTDSIEGVLVQESTGVVVQNNDAHDNALGIHIRNAERNVVRRNVANDNKWGIHLEFRAKENRIVDNVAHNNSNQDLMSRQDSTANVISRLDIGSGTFSFVTTNVALKGTDSTPSGPSDRGGVNSSASALAATSEELDPALDSLTVHYRNASGDVSSLAVWRDDGGSWTELDSSVQGSENTVSTGNVTEFGTFAAFGSSDVSGERVILDISPPTLTERSVENVSAANATASNGTMANETMGNGTMTNETATAGTDTTTGTATMTETATTTETTGAAATTEAATTTTGTTSSTTATPSPTETDTNTATTASADTTGSTTVGGDGAGGQTTETTGPGFSLLVGLVALLAAGLLATRRGRKR